MDLWTAQEQAYKRGYERGYEQGSKDSLSALRAWLVECQQVEKGLSWAIITAIIAKVDQMSAPQEAK